MYNGNLVRMLCILTCALLVAQVGVLSQDAPETLVLVPPTSSNSAHMTQGDIQLVADVVKGVLQVVTGSKEQNVQEMTPDLVQAIALQVLHDLATKGQTGQETATAASPRTEIHDDENVPTTLEINNNDNNNNNNNNQNIAAPLQNPGQPAVLVQHPTGSQQKQENLDLDQICRLPALGGQCRGYFPMFHYDVKKGQCEKFIYGGCGGNDNRFATEEECLTTCGQVQQRG